MSNNNYYKSDKCYETSGNYLYTLSGQRWLADNFYISTVSTAKDCESEALRYNSDFFFISDISTAFTDNKIYTNCYVPKFVNTGSLLTASAEIHNIFNAMFKKTGPDFTFFPISDDLVDDRKDINNSYCFKWRTDGQVYTKNKNNKNYYAYYKKPILDDANLNIMKNLMPPSFYQNKLQTYNTTQTNSNYIDFLKIGRNWQDNNNHGPLVKAFIDFIVNPNQTNLNTGGRLDSELDNLQTKYNTLESDLSAIKFDLSNINYINRFDDETLRAVNLNITNKTRELNSLLGSGGANNGRLDDTTLLTQFKIVENSILLLIIISAIFYFTNNKKLILAS